MEIQVETYDMLETMENQVFEVNDESNKLIDELELKGQKQIMSKDGERQAYNVLTEQQRFTCIHLFPRFTPIREYETGPIPYRVLKEAKAAKQFFKGLYILHEVPAVVKDPILVGTNQDYYYWHQGENKYTGLALIARWGEALEPWEKLFTRAQSVALKALHNGLLVFKSEVERAITLVENGTLPTNKSFNMQTLIQQLPYNYSEL